MHVEGPRDHCTEAPLAPRLLPRASPAHAAWVGTFFVWEKGRTEQKDTEGLREGIATETLALKPRMLKAAAFSVPSQGWETIWRHPPEAHERPRTGKSSPRALMSPNPSLNHKPKKII